MAGISSFNPFICKTLSVDRPCRRLGFKNPFSPSNSIIISSKNSSVGLKFSASTDGLKFSATDRNWAQPAKATDDEWGPEPKEELGSVATTALVEEEPSEVDKLKRGLVDSLNGTNRGLKASSETRAEILEFITQLEAKNPTPAPTEALPLLNGKWILAYTSFSDLFPLLGRSLPLLKVGEISQTIDSECFTVQNSVQFEGPLATTSLSTNAKFDVRSPKRVQIKFEEGIIGTPQLTDSIVVPENVEFLGQKIDLSPFKGIISSVQDTASSVVKSLSSQPPLKIPITNTNAQSWLLTTYLDEELRISRGDGGSVFVLIKEGSSLLTP